MRGIVDPRLVLLLGLCLQACTAEPLPAPPPEPLDMRAPCASGQELCGAACADTQADGRNCGGCGKACAAGEVCSRGACALECAAGTRACGQSCVDTATSASHCGGCDRACTGGQVCEASACRCPGALQLCGAECRDTAMDRANCGGCGNDCGVQGECVSSRCRVKDLGGGADGALQVMSGTRVINDVRSPAEGARGSRRLTLVQPAGFSAGQTILVHQSQDAAAPGGWELAVIAKVEGNALTLAAPLGHDYVTTIGRRAQAVVVPQHTDVTVAAGATLTAPPWDGSTGGILALQATGAVTVAGEIAQSGAGFRGFGHASFAGCFRCGGPNGFTGESALGPPVASAKVGAGYGQNNGGGGGGGTQGQDCAAGGGGGYGTAGAAGGDGTRGTCSGGFNGGGMAGLAYGDADLGQAVLFGGAGGEGGADEDGAYPGAGGNGGGIVLLWANQLTVTGKIRASGAPGGNGAQTSAACGGGGCGMSGGGGGAGGAIRIFAGQASLGADLVTAAGAGGGACTCSGGASGGTGGAGRIQVISANATGTTQPAFTN